MNGDGRPDLILVYSHLGGRVPSSWYAGGVPPSLRHDYVPEAAFLETVLAGGVSTRVKIPNAWAAAVDAVAHVNGTAASEVFLEVSRLSSGASVVAYGLSDNRLSSAGVTLRDGGDSATKTGFDCLPRTPPRLIQRAFELIGPTVYGWWRETDVIYAWHGPTLRRLRSHTFKRRGAVPSSDIGFGPGCIAGAR
jgi:hypothetical protein